MGKIQNIVSIAYSVPCSGNGRGGGEREVTEGPDRPYQPRAQDGQM